MPARRDIQCLQQDGATALDPRSSIVGSIEEAAVTTSVGACTKREARMDRMLAAVGLKSALRRRCPHELREPFSDGNARRKSRPTEPADALGSNLPALISDGADPPVTAGRWGTLIGYDPGPGRRRLVQFDRRGNLIAALRWRADGPLGWARCRTAQGSWVGIEPATATHPGWGASDRVWLLDASGPWVPREELTVFQSLDYERLDLIPPLAHPRRLPPGAGTAILDLLSGLMKDQGVTRVRYRGPYPTEQLFTALLESFRYDPAVADPLERFMDGGRLDWLPAPHERHHVAPGVTVQLRHEIDKVVLDGAVFYRVDWQGVLRREPRVARGEGDRVVCSLWALGRPIEDRLVLDRSGEVIETRTAAADQAPAAPLPPVWGPALAELIARESAPALAGSIREVMEGLALEWGGVAGDLLRVDGATIRVSRTLRDSAIAWLREAPAGAERAERAVRFALDVARLLGPAVRLLAQVRLEDRSAEEQQRALLEEGGDREAPPFSESIGRLLALISSGIA